MKFKAIKVKLYQKGLDPVGSGDIVLAQNLTVKLVQASQLQTMAGKV